MKKAYIINTAKGGAIEAIAKAQNSVKDMLGMFGFQPAPNDHVWRSMPNHGMTPHTSELHYHSI